MKLTKGKLIEIIRRKNLGWTTPSGRKDSWNINKESEPSL